MARAAVLTLLRDDQQLSSLGGTGFVVEPNFAGDQRPNSKGGFLIIRWGVTDFSHAVQSNAEIHFDVYAHWPLLLSTDFGRIDGLIDRCDAIFSAVESAPVAGGDGWVLDYVGFEGRGPDVEDEGYETICRRASYYALSHQAT